MSSTSVTLTCSPSSCDKQEHENTSETVSENYTYTDNGDGWIVHDQFFGQHVPVTGIAFERVADESATYASVDQHYMFNRDPSQEYAKTIDQSSSGVSTLTCDIPDCTVTTTDGDFFEVYYGSPSSWVQYAHNFSSGSDLSKIGDLTVRHDPGSSGTTTNVLVAVDEQSSPWWPYIPIYGQNPGPGEDYISGSQSVEAFLSFISCNLISSESECSAAPTVGVGSLVPDARLYIENSYTPDGACQAVLESSMLHVGGNSVTYRAGQALIGMSDVYEGGAYFPKAVVISAITADKTMVFYTDAFQYQDDTPYGDFREWWGYDGKSDTLTNLTEMFKRNPDFLDLIYKLGDDGRVTSNIDLPCPALRGLASAE